MMNARSKAVFCLADCVHWFLDVMKSDSHLLLISHTGLIVSKLGVDIETL